MHVLGEYTNSSLTYASDIFPALSGIAKAYQKIYDDTYVAGMWTKCLPKMLLWYFEMDPDVLNNNTVTWRAPSWSWASQNLVGRLSYLDCERSIAKVHCVACEPSGADPTGKLAFAHLTLATKLIPACLKRQGTEDAPDYAIQISDGHQIVSDKSDYANLRTNYFGLSDPRLAAGIPSLDIIIAQIGNSIAEVRLDYDYSIKDPVTTRDTFCLLLAKHSDNTERWSRIGILRITDNDEELALEDVKAQDEHKVDAYDEYNEVVGEKLRAVLKKRIEQARDTFRLFDEAPMQDITIW
jgi:hypothetical protein